MDTKSLYTETQLEMIRGMHAASMPAVRANGPATLDDLVRAASADLREFQAKNPGVVGRELRRARRDIALKYYRMGKLLRKTVSRGHPATASRMSEAATPATGVAPTTKAATP